MCKFRGEITVIGKEEHTGSIAVKASHGIDTLVACTLHEIHHSSASVGVIAGGNAILGLVEQYVALALQSHNLLIVFNHIVV